jgi:hypothetical protein
VGIGTAGSPYETKRLEDYEQRGGGHPFPSNLMVLDITEFMVHMSGPRDRFFLQVYDRPSSDSTGTVDFFSIEEYEDYSSGVPVATYVSAAPPLNTINSHDVYAQGATDPDSLDKLWILGGEAALGELMTAEVWLAYEGGGPDDSISSFDIPLTWDASVCTVETLTIGPDFSEWTDVSQIDNEGSGGPPSVPKVALSAYTLGPPVGPPALPQGTYLAGTVGFRILEAAFPPESTSVNALMEAFTPPVYLGFADKNGATVYTPLCAGDYVRVEGFPCGDCNGDVRVTVADATYLVSFIYREGPESLGSGDVNLDGRTTIADATYIVAYVYRGGPPPCEPPLGRRLGIKESH